MTTRFDQNFPSLTNFSRSKLLGGCYTPPHPPVATSLDEGPSVSWKSRKQPTVALSTCEAEYMALTDAVQEAKFLKQLCVDLGIVQVSFSVILNVDNQGAINLARNPMYHKRSKHIDVKYHFIRSEVSRGTVKLVYIPTNENVADIFTKPVSKVKLDTFGSFISGK